MKRKFFVITPYLFGLLYLIYCLCQIESRIKRHLGFEEYVFYPFAFALGISLIWIGVSLFGKKNSEFHFSLFLGKLGIIIFYVLIGIIISLIGSKIPCCTG